MAWNSKLELQYPIGLGAGILFRQMAQTTLARKSKSCVKSMWFVEMSEVLITTTCTLTKSLLFHLVSFFFFCWRSSNVNKLCKVLHITRVHESSVRSFWCSSSYSFVTTKQAQRTSKAAINANTWSEAPIYEALHIPRLRLLFRTTKQLFSTSGRRSVNRSALQPLPRRVSVSQIGHGEVDGVICNDYPRRGRWQGCWTPFLWFPWLVLKRLD